MDQGYLSQAGSRTADQRSTFRTLEKEHSKAIGQKSAGDDATDLFLSARIRAFFQTNKNTPMGSDPI